MPDDVKKPSQTDSDRGWGPGDSPDWHEIELYGNNGVPRNRPNIMEWDELDPKTNGITITHQDSTNLLKVMCGGLVYEINFDNLYPPLPAAQKAPAGACVPPRKGQLEQSYIAEVKDVEYAAWYRQTKCLFQINCRLSYTLVKKTMRCDHSLKKWVAKPGKAETQDVVKTRANFFTCAC